MSPVEISGAVTALLAVILGPAGITALRRRAAAPDPPASPAAEVRDAAPVVASLAASLTLSDERVKALEERVDALEGSVWRCPIDVCPVRDQLRES